MRLLRNPYFLGSCLLFVLHQVLDKFDIWHHWLVDGYLDDFLSMPILLTVLLVEQKDLFGKERFELLEVLGYVVVFAVLFECVFPWFSTAFVGDWVDVLMYLCGGLFFFWKINPVVGL